MSHVTFFRKSKIKLPFILSLLCIGCNHLPKQLPEDFELQIVNTAVQPEKTGRYVSLVRLNNSSGRYEFIQDYNKVTDTLVLSRYQIQRLYQEVRKARIFRLKRKYEDLNVLDGSNTTLTIKANSKTKVISMRNTYPTELKNVLLILNEFESQLNNDN